MIDKEAFTREFSALSAFLERRRYKYLRFFYAAVLASLLLAASALCIPAQVMHIAGRLFFITRPVNQSDIIAYRIFVPLLCMMLVIRPVHSYRNMRFTLMRQAGLSKDYSLKDACYARMFELFGPYEFTPNGSIPFGSIRQSVLCGQHPDYAGRHCVSGISHETGVKICDMTITGGAGQKDSPPFQGVLSVFDISQTQVKLRKPFKGKAVLAETVLCDGLAGRPLKKVTLPQALAGAFSAYSSDITEAQRILCDPVAQTIVELARITSGSKSIGRHIDDRVAEKIEGWYEWMKEKAISALGKAELPSEKAYDRVHSTAANKEIKTMQAHIALEYYEDKCIVFIPCRRGLAESKSLFAPAMSEDSAELLYAVMKFTDGFSMQLNRLMP